MLLQGKCAAIPEQIESKIEYGITDYELQLFAESQVDEVITVLSNYPNIRFNTVHTALDEKHPFIKSVTLDNLDNPLSKSYFMRACYIAQWLAERQQSKVGVVIHCEFTAEQFNAHPSVFNSVCEILTKTARQFADIYVMFENVSPYDAESLELCNSVSPKQVFDIITLFKRKNINLYVTLDLCHNKMTKDTFEKMLLGTSLQKQWAELESALTYKGWFSLLNDYIANVHIAKAVGDGHDHGKHGAPLNSFDKASISQLYEMCKMYSPNAIWTVEVFEDDYANPVNLFATYELCKHVFGGTNQ